MASKKENIDIWIRARDLATKQFKKIGSSFKSMAKSLLITGPLNLLKSGLTKIINLFKTLLKVAAAALAVVSAMIVKVGATYEKSMSRVLALSGANNEGFLSLENSAKLLGETTEFSAAQAAEAMSELAKAGFKVNEIVGVMPSVLNLASAGQLEMADAAGIAAGIMRGMNLQAKDMSMVVDILAKSFTGSMTDLSELGEAMKTLGPIASFAGKDITEMSAVLMALAQANLRGEQGGTALRNILVKLSSATGGAKKTLDGMVSSLTKSSGKMIHMADLVEEMNNSLAGLTAPQKLAKLTEVLGLRAGPAMAALINQGADAIREFERQVISAGGTSDRIRNTQLDNLMGDFVKFKSIVQGVGIEIYNVFSDELRRSMQNLTKYFQDNKQAIIDWSKVIKDKLADAKNFLMDFIKFAKNDWVTATDFMWDAMLIGLKAILKSAVSMAIAGGKAIWAGIKIGIWGDPIGKVELETRTWKLFFERSELKSQPFSGKHGLSEKDRALHESLIPVAQEQLEQEMIDDLLGGNIDRISGYFKTAGEDIKSKIPSSFGSTPLPVGGGGNAYNAEFTRDFNPEQIQGYYSRTGGNALSDKEVVVLMRQMVQQNEVLIKNTNKNKQGNLIIKESNM